MKRRVKMKKLFLTILMILFVAVGVNAQQVTLEWDAQDPTPDGFRLFYRLDQVAYDYTSPIYDGAGDVFTATVTIPDLTLEGAVLTPANSLYAIYDRATSSITFGFNQGDLEAVQRDVFFVARAYLNGPPAEESGDSNEVSTTQSLTDTVDHWQIYYSEDQVNWIDFVSVNTATEITEPFTYVTEGQVKTIYFTVVTFGASGAFSANAAPVSVVIDRRTLVPPVLHEITIPVQ